MKISMRIVTLALLALCMALFTSGAMAQTSTTGSIEGQVVDTNGNPVPGVTVAVTSPNLITPQSAVSNDEGRYRILNLPPGMYKITVEASKGFAAFERSNVEVNLSKSSAVEVTLQPAGATAVVNVTDTAGANVDVTSNTTGSNISTEQFSNFPTQRTVQSLYNLAPTVARSGLRDASGRDRDPSVAGSSGPENNYILDGVNTTDPAFGGSGANLPFEFVQEVEIKTGAYGAEYGKATGGIFNVVTKSGGNNITGDAFAYFTTKSMVRNIKFTPFTGSIPESFSEIDAGFDIGGPIKKDKLWFFGAFNPQRRKNFLLTQTFLQPVENQITTPFYAGKLTYAINQNNVFTFSTFGDFTKQEGFLGGSGFGAAADIANIFNGTRETGGHNYAFRLNSTIRPTMIGEFSVGLHFQRNNTIPLSTGTSLITDNFAVLGTNGQIVNPTQTNVNFGGSTGFVDYAYAPGGTLQRGFLRGGFGLYGPQDRNRYEAAARMQNIWGKMTFKYGFEWNRNIYNIGTLSTGPANTFPDPNNLRAGSNDPAGLNQVNGFRISNGFVICTTRGTTVVCPNATGFNRINAAIGAGQVPGFTTALLGPITTAEILRNPFLVRSTTTVRDFELTANTYTSVESFYIQDDYKISRDVQINAGLRWDYQQSYGADGGTYLKLNSFMDNMQPRVGLIWDFTGKGKGKLFINYARFLETPIPLDINVRAGGGGSQTDKNFRVNRVNAPLNAPLTQAIGNLGADATPIDPDLKPQTVNEATAGFEYEIMKDVAIGARGIYRTQGSVIEDGSFDDGNSYFLFNPGESLTDRLAETVTGARFGRARRYYRAVELTATKRFSNNYQFIASYVFSSLIGNYEGLFRNDNGQSDPNITSLFDLVSLLFNTYGRLPNDRPHQFKFNGSYQTPFKLLVSGNFYAQSGIPFNQLIPHPVYGNNEGFGVPRGTAIVPDPTATAGAGSTGGMEGAIGSTRTPLTWNLDLGAYYPIQLGERRQLRFQVDWFNVFNNQKAVRLDETFSLTTGIAGVNVTNPFYGTGTIFQFPSSVRLGVKFQF